MQPIQSKFLAFRIFHARDAEAYRQLYREYRDKIHRFLAHKLPRHEDADEAVSEVFLRGWEYMTANRVEFPQALLYKIAQNVVAGFYQKRERHPQEVLTETMEATIPSTVSLVDDTASAEGLANILHKIDELKDEHKQVLLLKYVDELTVEEIGMQLGKTANNIRVILFRARTAIKKLL